jgi:hypothetical protein
MRSYIKLVLALTFSISGPAFSIDLLCNGGTNSMKIDCKIKRTKYITDTCGGRAANISNGILRCDGDTNNPKASGSVPNKHIQKSIPKQKLTKNIKTQEDCQAFITKGDFMGNRACKTRNRASLVSSKCSSGSGTIRLGIVKCDTATQSSKPLELDESIDRLVNQNNKCPDRVLDLEGVAGCNAYKVKYNECLSGDDGVTSVCHKRAQYDIIVPQGLKNLCSSTDKDSCILFSDTVIKCKKAKIDTNTCIKAATAVSKARDSLAENHVSSAVDGFEACISKGKKRVNDCKKEAEGDAIARALQAKIADSNKIPGCDELEAGAQTGKCGNFYYTKDSSAVNDLEEWKQSISSDPFDELENEMSGATPEG